MKAIRALKIVLKDTIFSGEKQYLQEAIHELENFSSSLEYQKLAWKKYSAIIKTQIASLYDPKDNPIKKVELEYWDMDNPKSQFFKTEKEAYEWLESFQLKNIKG